MRRVLTEPSAPRHPASLEHLSDPVSVIASIARLAGETFPLVTDLLRADNPIARSRRLSNAHHFGAPRVQA